LFDQRGDLRRRRDDGIAGGRADRSRIDRNRKIMHPVSTIDEMFYGGCAGRLLQPPGVFSKSAQMR